MYWYPQALFTAEQACRRRFLFLFNDAPFSNMSIFNKKTFICTNIYGLCIFLKTTNRRGTQIHSKWRQNFVLSSHIDLIGDQNDVRYLLIYLVYLVPIGNTIFYTIANI